MKNGRIKANEHKLVAAQPAIVNSAESGEANNATGATVVVEKRASATSGQPAAAPPTGSGDLVVATPNLSAKERKSALAKYEKVVSSGVQSVWEMGRALIAIRDEKLYLGSYDTFEDYLRDRWGMGRSHGYRLIAASEVADVLSPIGDKAQLPAHESVLRPLVGLKAEDAQAAWKSALAKAGDGRPVTAKLVKAAAAEFTPIKPKRTAAPAVQSNDEEGANRVKDTSADENQFDTEEETQRLDVAQLEKALDLVGKVYKQLGEDVSRDILQNHLSKLMQILRDLKEAAQG